MISIKAVTSENFSHSQGPILEIEKGSFSSPWSLTAFEKEISNPVSQLWVVERDERLVGYICFWLFAGEIHLMNIAVHPSQRGRGFGRLLLVEMIRTGLSRGVDTIWLEVRPSNFVARVLYQKLGFKEIARRRRYYTDTNEDAIVMALSTAPEKSKHLSATAGISFKKAI